MGEEALVKVMMEAREALGDTAVVSTAFLLVATTFLWEETTTFLWEETTTSLVGGNNDLLVRGHGHFLLGHYGPVVGLCAGSLGGGCQQKQDQA